MKSLFDPEAKDEIFKRLESLSADAKAEWGKMNSSQMLAHCGKGLEMATGKIKPKRILIGRIIGPLFKHNMTNDKPFTKNSPTDPALVMTGSKNFDEEMRNLKKHIELFHKGGPEKATRHPHPFFGKMTPETWGISAYKHLDHHLRQFGK